MANKGWPNKDRQGMYLCMYFSINISESP